MATTGVEVRSSLLGVPAMQTHFFVAFRIFTLHICYANAIALSAGRRWARDGGTCS